ncbi:MAG: hypothetical protein GEU98_09250 [Pseudonocardiaceae bacterium]|nr:hypothetical protein [Pseudonocardiaceae bacterium]
MANLHAVIFNDPIAGPVIDPFARGNDFDRTVFVPAADEKSAAKLASSLENDGVQRIEVCGALGPRTAAAVLEATGNRISVGVCTFGIESIAGAATFDQKISGGNQVAVAILYVSKGANPVADRVVIERGVVRMIFVPVPHESAAASEATALVDSEKVDLVELYRGIGQTATAQVIDAIADRIPIGSTA